MRILHITSDLYPQVMGGIGIHVHEISRLEANFGNKVTVMTSKHKGQKDHEFVDNYEVFRFRSLLTLFGNPISLSCFFQLLEFWKDYDIIHAHSHLFFSTNMCGILRKLHSSPLIITNHGLLSQSVPMWIQRIFIPTVGKFTFNSADKVVCYTETEKKDLIKIGVTPEKITIIHNGIDTKIFVPGKKKIKDKNILWIGRYTPGKGVHYLVEAFYLIVNKHPDAHLVMVGDGPTKEDIQKQILSLGLSEHITLHHFIPNEHLPVIYQEATVFVLPSLVEGVPRTILEAMASGVPVVCTDLPQQIDIVKGAGILVPLRNSDAIAQAVEKIFSDTRYAHTLGECGRSRILEQYSWEDTVRQTVSLYKEIICQESV